MQSHQSEAAFVSFPETFFSAIFFFFSVTDSFKFQVSRKHKILGHFGRGESLNRIKRKIITAK